MLAVVVEQSVAVSSFYGVGICVNNSGGQSLPLFTNSLPALPDFSWLTEQPFESFEAEKCFNYNRDK